MILTLTPREATVNINKKTITIGTSNETFIKTLESEAMKLRNIAQEKPHLQTYIKDIFKEINQIWMKESKSSHLKHHSFALTSLLATPIIPPELIEIILTIIAVLAAIGVGGAMIGGMLAGIWKMAFGKQKADEWTTNIIKGLVQVLGTPVIVALIVSIFVLLFSHLPAFKPILEPIGVFFHQ